MKKSKGTGKRPPQRMVKKQTNTTTVKRKTLGITNGFSYIVENYKHAVVNIEVMQTTRVNRQRSLPIPWDIFENRQRLEPQVMNIGTGFVFDPRGYILTNEHVLHGADIIQVRFFNDESPVRARVIGTDYDHDLAILKVQLPKRTPILQLGNSKDVKVGEWVMAIGNPLGLDHSVTVGIISATERPITIGDRHYDKLLQTDAAINRGNSGGPLINLQGQVVGINTAVSQSSQGIGFAISVDVAKEVIQKILKSKGTP